MAWFVTVVMRFEGLIALFGKIVGPIKRDIAYTHIYHGVLRNRIVKSTQALIYSFTRL